MDSIVISILNAKFRVGAVELKQLLMLHMTKELQAHTTEWKKKKEKKLNALNGIQTKLNSQTGSISPIIQYACYAV